MRGMLAKIKQKGYLTVIIVLMLLYSFFLSQNTGEVTVSLFIWSFAIPRTLLFLAIFCTGIIICWATVIEYVKMSSEPVNKKHFLFPYIQKIINQKAQLKNLKTKLKRANSNLETMDAASLDATELLSTSHLNQLSLEWQLSTAKADLEKSVSAISLLKKELSDLKEELDVKEFIDRLLQHDLRGSLVASVSLPKLLLDDSTLTESQKEIVGVMLESGEKMLEILNSSLILYRLEESTYQPELTNVNLYKILITVVERMRKTLLYLKQDIEIKCLDTDCQAGKIFQVYGDEFLLFSIFMNLISNASEASPHKKTISIILSQNEYCSISIRNYGEVPKSIRKIFFNKMVTSGKKFGTGLGTYSAMLMTKAQGGTIEMNCSEPGITTIHVSLRKPPAQEK